MDVDRYYFTILDGKLLIDTQGVICGSWDKVREQAIETAGTCLKDLATNYPTGLEWQLVVTNNCNETVMRLRFSINEGKE